jgi:hypothetical protein
MTAILAEVLAVSPDYTIMNIFTVAVIAAAGVACAISLRKKGGKTA